MSSAGTPPDTDAATAQPRAPLNAPASLPADLAAGATGFIQVDLAAVGANWQALRDHAAPARTAAVVKANAYGLGIDRVAPALHKAGCQSFFVATFDEAKHLRALLPDAAIFMLNGLTPDTLAATADANIIPVLSTMDEIQDWAAHALETAKTLPTCLHVDTGLNRLGLEASDIRELAANNHWLQHLKVYLIMSHLSSADEPDDPMNTTQREIFEGLWPILPTVAASLAASDGMMIDPAFGYQLVRPGYALYGGQASAATQAPVQPVVQAYARVLQVRDIATGEAVGYCATYRAEAPRRIATIAAGYADGIPRMASAGNGERGGMVAFDGRLAPIVGRVSMDLITVDITDIGDVDIRRGDWAELIGPTLSMEQVGENAATIGYEILTNLSRRFHRSYVGGA